MENGLNQRGLIGQDIDWSSPWLPPVRDLGMQVASESNWRDTLNQLALRMDLRNHRKLPVQFVSQETLPAGQSYEAFISKTGNVPTRDNLHDFFNALIWLTFPHTKAQLNALQSAQIATLGIGKSRGPARDAATLFDENAALLAISDSAEGSALADDLRLHRWSDVFVQRRAQFVQDAEVILFGHAIMEKLVRPYKAITAHTFLCRVRPDFHQLPQQERVATLDRQVAIQLAQQALLPRVFSPLPVLGVPGWWPKQDIEFYADTEVFRPPRRNS